MFAGNTGDPTTVAAQVSKLKDRFGVTRVVLVGDRGMLTAARLREDVGPAKLDWITYLKALSPNGTLCLVGSPPGFLQIPAASLFDGQKSISGSEIGSRATIAEMLRFAARHKINPVVEKMPLDQVKAWHHGEIAKYRDIITKAGIEKIE